MNGDTKGYTAWNAQNTDHNNRAVDEHDDDMPQRPTSRLFPTDVRQECICTPLDIPLKKSIHRTTSHTQRRWEQGPTEIQTKAK